MTEQQQKAREFLERFSQAHDFNLTIHAENMGACELLTVSVTYSQLCAIANILGNVAPTPTQIDIINDIFEVHDEADF